MGRLQPENSSPTSLHHHDPPSQALPPSPPPIAAPNHEPVGTASQANSSPPPPHQLDQNSAADLPDDQSHSSTPLPSPKPKSPPAAHHGEIEPGQAEAARPGPFTDNRIVLYSPPPPPPPPEPGQHRTNGLHEEIGVESMPAVPFPPCGPPGPGPQEPPVAAKQVVAAPPLLVNGTVRQKQPQKGQPQVIIVPFVGVPWTSGLFDCCQHPRNALITTVAPCVTFGQIAEILDNGSTGCLTGASLYFFLFLVICHWNVGVRYRRRMRSAFNLAETPVTDKIAHTLFPLCALCQEFRELKDRGYDPFLGYQGVIAGIVHDQKQQAPLSFPPPNQSMTR